MSFEMDGFELERVEGKVRFEREDVESEGVGLDEKGWWMMIG